MSDIPSTDLQDAIDTPIFVDVALPIEERRHQTRAVATLKKAAGLVANGIPMRCQHGYNSVAWSPAVDGDAIEGLLINPPGDPS